MNRATFGADLISERQWNKETVMVSAINAGWRRLRFSFLLVQQATLVIGPVAQVVRAHA